MQKTPEKFDNLLRSTSKNDDLITEPKNSNDNPQSSLLNKNLTQEQLEQINTNRKRALQIRESKEREAKLAKTGFNSLEPKKLLDTGAGFFINEEDLIDDQKNQKRIAVTPTVPLPNEQLLCKRCDKRFPYSYLSINFNYNICDSCRVEYSDDFKLITRTDAKNEFLLRDYDLDLREPPLKFIIRKNPHNKKWGEMKLFLKCQIQERALEVHENIEKLEEKKEEKISNLQKSRQKNYEKKLQELRKEARHGAKKLSSFHIHEYEGEEYDDEKEIYFKKCKTCDFKQEYEEL